MRVTSFYLHKELVKGIIADQKLSDWLEFRKSSDPKNISYLLDLTTGYVWLNTPPVHRVKPIDEFNWPTIDQLRTITNRTRDFPNRPALDDIAQSDKPYLKLTKNRAFDLRKNVVVDIAKDCLGYPVNTKIRDICLSTHSNQFFENICSDRIKQVKTILMEKGYASIQQVTKQSLNNVQAYLPQIQSYLLKQENLQNQRPELTRSRLFDNPDEGMWNLALQTPLSDEYLKVEFEQRLVATDFTDRTVHKDAVIAIDFGTSSTVVARFQPNKKDKIQLLPIGLQDLHQELSSKDYENPTILEFLSAEGFYQWKKTPYRPMMGWDQVRCSHVARNQFRRSVQNAADASHIARVLSNIKMLVRDEVSQDQLEFRDREGQIFSVDKPTLHEFDLFNPIQLHSGYLLDPVEIYAWHVGLNLNNHDNGIYLKYHLTFPVQYTKDYKDKILASFRRGLMRSLPDGLFNVPEYYQEFSVTEVATEPAAFAAAVLMDKDIEPDDDDENGTAFAVFDFGGGTTDFAYGYWRWADEDENPSERGYTYVLNHFHPAGDIDLGGENLLWSVAYQVYTDNKALMREHQIPFHKPYFESDVPGYEHLLKGNYQARTNRHLLVEKLRTLWEDPETFLSRFDEEEDSEEISEEVSMNDQDLTDVTDKVVTVGKLDERMLTLNGEPKTVTFTINIQKLRDLLKTRVQNGVENFFAHMKQAFKEDVPETIHVFLAGNSCKSDIVQELFQLDKDVEERDYSHFWPKDEGCPDKIVCEFVSQSDDLNSKTGVALGMLELREGSQVLEDGPLQGESLPFSWIVGHLKKGKFKPVLTHESEFETWQKMSAIQNTGVYQLYYTQNPKALDVNDSGLSSLKRKDASLLVKEIRFNNPEDTDSVYVRASGIESIEVCIASGEPDGSEIIEEVKL